MENVKNQYETINKLNNKNIINFYKDNNISLITIKNILTHFDSKNILYFLNYSNEENIQQHKNYILKYFYNQYIILDNDMFKWILTKMKERNILNKNDISDLNKLYSNWWFKYNQFLEQLIFDLNSLN
jgi:hypothetical protein